MSQVYFVFVLVFVFVTNIFGIWYSSGFHVLVFRCYCFWGARNDSPSHGAYSPGTCATLAHESIPQSTVLNGTFFVVTLFYDAAVRTRMPEASADAQISTYLELRRNSR